MDFILQRITVRKIVIKIIEPSWASEEFQSLVEKLSIYRSRFYLKSIILHFVHQVSTEILTKIAEQNLANVISIDISLEESYFVDAEGKLYNH